MVFDFKEPKFYWIKFSGDENVETDVAEIRKIGLRGKKADTIGIATKQILW